MNHSMRVLESTPLFEGIPAKELEILVNECLDASFKEVRKGACVLRVGAKATRMGIVVSGRVHIEQTDFWGNRNILTSIGEGGIFGESIVLRGHEIQPVSVRAQENSVVLLMSHEKVLHTCASACGCHQTLIYNLLILLARKNVSLTCKLEHITKKSTRDKVLSYLSEQATRAGSDQFSIPFNRQELADFLSVDRSALSSCLSALARQGILTYRKNQFRLLKN